MSKHSCDRDEKSRKAHKLLLYITDSSIVYVYKGEQYVLKPMKGMLILS